MERYSTSARPAMTRRRERWIMPLQAEELHLLRQCEETIDAGLADFLRVGEALLTIAGKKLYRATHRTFAEYCLERWGLPKRTAHLKMQIAETYEKVHNCALFPPMNEYQVRQLLPLPTPELQQVAWQRAVARGGTLTASTVRDTVREVQREQDDAPLTACLLPDRIFPGIPYRWEVCCYANTEEMGQRKLQPSRLPVLTGQGTPATPAAETESPTLVLVSPDIDIFTGALPAAYLRQLVALFTRAPYCRFLLWSAHPGNYQVIADWPSNVELAVRIETQQHLQQLPAAPIFPLSALWFVPREPLSLPQRFPCTRALIGAPLGTTALTTLDSAACRQLIADVLAEPRAVHLATTVQHLLYHNAL